MSNQEFIELIRSIQASQPFDWVAYIAVSVFAGAGGYLASYFNEKGKNYANKEDFENLKNQLGQNTSLVESIKSKLSEKSWITQQVWIKKQEAYETIFEQLFHVRRYTNHQLNNFEEWQYVNHRHPYMDHYQYDEGALLRLWEKEKSEYEEKIKNPLEVENAEKLKTNHMKSISTLIKIIEIKSIYLDPRVDSTITTLKLELSRTEEHEDWEEHFHRIKNSTDLAINEIRAISKSELSIET